MNFAGFLAWLWSNGILYTSCILMIAVIGYYLLKDKRGRK